MTKDEAKAFLAQAGGLIQSRQFQQAHGLLTQVDAAFPNSVRVGRELVACLIGLGRIEEAEALCTRMAALPGADVESLRQRIAEARPAKFTPGTTPSAAVGPRAQNEFFVEAVNPGSAAETCVMGHVTRGAFYSGSTVSVMTSDGLPLLAPIVRITAQETPLNVVREGPLITMILRIEPQYISLGAKITSNDSGAAYAPTMIVDTSSGAGKTGTVFPSAFDPRLQEALRLVDQRSFGPAKEILDAYMKNAPENYESHRLLARVFLEADHELQNNVMGLAHIMRAYEMGGHESPAVLEILAYALGANGRSEHGLRHLERLYDMAMDTDVKENYVKRINAYRARHRIPDVWQFLDGFGAVILESNDIEQIRKAIEKKNIPEDAMCRKNKVGRLAPVKESIALEQPEITALFKPPPQAFLAETLIGALAGVLAGVVLSMGLNLINPLLGILLGGVLGAIIGVIAGVLRANRPIGK